VTKITVDGHPATLMNLTRTLDASHPEGFLDGSLGCPERCADRAEGCFGPQPNLLLRLAVIDVGDTTCYRRDCLGTWGRGTASLIWDGLVGVGRMRESVNKRRTLPM